MASYVYLHVKLYLEDGQTEDTVQEIVQELDYSFDHNQITDYEIVDVVDMNLSESREEGGSDSYEMVHDKELYSNWSE
jgi:hypothetical protein